MTPGPFGSLAGRIAAGFVQLLFALCRALGPVRASNFGAALLGHIGPLLPVNRIAAINLELAFPDRDAAFRRATIRAMWRNLGRVGAELANLPAIIGAPAAADGAGWSLEGAEHLRELAAAGGPAIFFSAHLGNWEILPGAAIREGVDFALVYRAIANPRVDAMVQRLRRAGSGRPTLALFPKGAEGARGILAHLRAGGSLGLLADQKMNDGIAAPLFGRAAMTAPAAAQLALRFACPLVPVRTLRLGPARLGIVVEAPLARPETGTRAGDIAALTAAMNARIEAWVRDRPGEWLWLHRRFDKAIYRR